MILADTSIWADHIRRGNATLQSLLVHGEIVIHEFVLGELLLGHVKRGALFDQAIRHLAVLPTARHDEVIRLVEGHRLQGSGIGWVDAHLLAAALVSGHRVWTFDKLLDKAAAKLGVARIGPALA